MFNFNFFIVLAVFNFFSSDYMYCFSKVDELNLNFILHQFLKINIVTRILADGQVPFYAAAQVTGAISAAFTLRVLLHPIKLIGTTSPAGSDIQALIMEIVVTFSMMFITSAVATDTKAVRKEQISSLIYYETN